MRATKNWLPAAILALSIIAMPRGADAAQVFFMPGSDAWAFEWSQSFGPVALSIWDQGGETQAYAHAYSASLQLATLGPVQLGTGFRFWRSGSATEALIWGRDWTLDAGVGFSLGKTMIDAEASYAEPGLAYALTVGWPLPGDAVNLLIGYRSWPMDRFYAGPIVGVELRF